MKRVLPLFLILLTLSCGSNPPTTVPRRTRPPTATSFPGQGDQGRCGDGVCEGPEDSSNCPSDCPPPDLSPGLKETPPAAADWTITLGPVEPDQLIRPLLGVNVGPVPAGEPGNADVTAGYQQIGVTMIRTHDFYGPLDMAVMYPDRRADPGDPNSYDLTQSDAVFAAILEGGFEPYLRLGDSWNNAAPPEGPEQRANWVRAAVEVVRHYREGQWDGFHSDLRYVEIWNEPEFRQFWPEPHTREEFLQLYAETARALKQAFPDLQVGGPGFTPAGALVAQGNRYVYEFLDYMQAEQVPLDFLSWHMYGNDVGDFAAAAGFYRDLLDEYGYGETSLHVSEWNTGINDSMEQQERVALRLGGRGSAVLTAAWITLQEQGIAQAFFYRGTDSNAADPTWYGLFYADGRPKRIALAFSLWAELVDHPDKLQLITTPDNSSEKGLWLLAGQNERGEVALLLANPNDKATNWQLALVDEKKAGALTVKQISDASEEIQIFRSAEPVVEIGPHTVQLVLLEP